SLVIDGKAVVNDIKGNDVTSYFITGAEKALETATKNNIRAAILKDKSPSCGSAFIYDGTFTKILKSGRGVTTALLERHGIRVFNEKDIEDALKIY
ncbi:MAG: DUF523 domain-containing protein, partial [Proteobacteria bacterium]|nr:DUF523 domain-containing protein [Pseudomonadota bacterium]